MPQILLEYTSNLTEPNNLESLVLELHKRIQAICSIDIKNCKTRVNILHQFYIGQNQTDNAFIHLEIKLFEGRTPDTKSKLAELAIKLLKNYFSINNENFSIDFTVHILDIIKQEYFKYSS
ncbi:MAG: 5-carboxymethyl-2-hydroxymuconate Delta-isomerase [Candidatus Hodarchaeales archaeon]|jgi:5-carboxymethyl-2-hydroxymuconate isomerase